MQEIIALAQVCGNDRISLAKSLLNIFVNENQEIKLLRVMNDKEIEKEGKSDELVHNFIWAICSQHKQTKITESYIKTQTNYDMIMLKRIM